LQGSLRIRLKLLDARGQLVGEGQQVVHAAVDQRDLLAQEPELLVLVQEVREEEEPLDHVADADVAEVEQVGRQVSDVHLDVGQDRRVDGHLLECRERGQVLCDREVGDASIRGNEDDARRHRVNAVGGGELEDDRRSEANRLDPVVVRVGIGDEVALYPVDGADALGQGVLDRRRQRPRHLDRVAAGGGEDLLDEGRQVVQAGLGGVAHPERHGRQHVAGQGEGCARQARAGVDGELHLAVEGSVGQIHEAERVGPQSVE
jgi:hypothetical protein